jgi:tetratricopeptide (TPR) repeat protein
MTTTSSNGKPDIKRTAPKKGPVLSVAEFLSLKEARGDLLIEVDGSRVSLTSLDRVYWPDEQLTKFDLLCYYIRVSEFIMPFLDARPAILQRWPRGIKAPMFFQQDLESAPDFIKTAHLTNQEGRELDYAVYTTTASLLHFVNLGTIEQHPWHSTSKRLAKPDWIAIDLDPKFALALARYSQLESWMLRTHEGTSEHREKARSLAERALQLQPDLPEAHLALGFSYYYGDNNYDAALREFEIAQRGLPNESEVYLAIGAIQRRQGKWAESTANLEKSASLNPKDTWPLQNLAMNYQMLRNFDAANRTVDRGLQINPQAIGLWEIKVKLAMAEKGDFSVYEQAVEKGKSFSMSDEERVKIIGEEANLLLFQRKYEQLLQLGQRFSDDSLAAVPGSLAMKYFAIGIAQKGLGDDAAARAALLRSKDILEQQVKQKPDDADLRVQLAKMLAWLGEKNAAIAQAQRAMDLRPESKDAFEGPPITEQAAQVYAILGDNARAIELLDGLLSRPSEVTVQTLKVNPAWDPLRNDPAFQALFAKYAGKA